MSRSKREGFTLLEVMLALTILSVGILAILAALNLTLRASIRAARIEEAAELAQNQLELAVGAAGSASELSQGASGVYAWSVQYAERSQGLVLATAVVKWNERGEPQQFQVSQLYRPQQ